MDFLLTLWGTAAEPGFFSSVLSITWRVILVLLGINALIIVHEWGHFITARMCGVRCDKFYIWFDAYGFKFFSFKWGETEYGLGWLPLGGYVKMLGQEDSPGNIKAELDRARQGVDENGIVLETPVDKAKIAELERAAFATDSYQAKNVYQRMLIISAGVIMNVIFAVICAFGAAIYGVPEASSQLGQIMPGTPAWNANILPGDKVLAINGQPVTLFQDLMVAMMDGQEVNLTIERVGLSKPIDVKVTPEMKKGAMVPTIGIQRGSALELANITEPYETRLSAKENADIIKTYGALKGKDRLLKVNDREMKIPADYEIAARTFIDQPIQYVFERKQPLRAAEQIVLSVEPRKKSVSGIYLSMGEITMVQKGSPAEKIGLIAQQTDQDGNIIKHGDRIIAVNGATVTDPLRLPCQFLMIANKMNIAVNDTANNTNADAKTAETKKDSKANAKNSGSSAAGEVVLTVLREGNKKEDLTLTLDPKGAYTGFLTHENCLGIGQLGVTYEVLPIISGMDSEVKNIQGPNKTPIGGTIEGIEMMIAAPDKKANKRVLNLYRQMAKLGKKASKESGIVFEPKKEGASDAAEMLHWFTNYIENLPEGTVLKVYVRQGDEVQVLQTKVKRTGDMFMLDRGFYFDAATVLSKANSLGSALKWAWYKTVDMMGLVFKFLKNIGSTVSPKALGGPIMIVGAAYATTADPGSFLLFLCMIGANLAVVNFLPIPVLDGGHMAFLLYEMIFRKPPQEKIMIALSYMGFILLLGLMFWVIFLDVARLITGSMF